MTWTFPGQKTYFLCLDHRLARMGHAIPPHLITGRSMMFGWHEKATLALLTAMLEEKKCTPESRYNRWCSCRDDQGLAGTFQLRVTEIFCNHIARIWHGQAHAIINSESVHVQGITIIYAASSYAAKYSSTPHAHMHAQMHAHTYTAKTGVVYH